MTFEETQNNNSGVSNDYCNQSTLYVYVIILVMCVNKM